MRSATVSRTALVDRLEKDDAPITSVVAPAGYGKTTLLAQWASRTPSKVAWLSLDRHDNDLSQLLSYTTAALDRVEPIDAALLPPPTARSVATAASGVAAAMAAMKEPVTLILDHVELLENAECRDAVAELALHLPTGVRLAIATRGEPPLPVPRLRAGGDIIEIGAEDLAMNEVEARALLADAGVALDPADLASVIERAEGWPVGLYLGALVLKAGGPRENAGIAFTGDDRLVAEYLRAELLEHLSDEEVVFLTRTAVLDRLSARLCDAVLAQAGSGEILESLAHSNLLLVSLDRQGEWYRYHHLFRDLLSAELARREPELVPSLHVRASDWCEQNGFPEFALAHAESAGDADRLNRLLLAHAPALYAVGRRASIYRWIMWFEDQNLVEQYPALATLGALLFSTTGREGDAERWAAAVEHPSQTPMFPGGQTPAERALPDRVLPDGSTLAGWLAVLRLSLCRDGLDGVDRDAADAAAGLAPGSGYRAGALAFEAIARFLRGEVEEADTILVRAVALAVDMMRMPAAVTAASLRGLIASARGDWNDAEERCKEALAFVTASNLDEYSESALAFVLAAHIAANNDDGETAREFSAQAARLRPQLTYGRPLVSGLTLLELARFYADSGDAAGAREVIRQARVILRLRPNLGTLAAQLDAIEARLETIRTGRVGASSLTSAELRLVPFLPTHLTFPQIAERLHVSRNTAKTHAISIYQKLGVSSRGEAVQQLQILGLIDS
jgi:LuxR family maltose regulon positive regulatory protein